MKPNLFISLALFLSLSSCATEKKSHLTSPFKSTVTGVTIPNTHLMAQKAGFVMRGMVPYTPAQVQELVRSGVTQVLIFRNDSTGESGVADEIKLLNQAHISAQKIHHIPFKWRGLTEFNEPCVQAVEALKLIDKVLKTPGEGLYFHCTVGEDRTGYLAGLYRMIFESQSAEQAFQNEMCGRGYAEADPTKPAHVSELVHANLTEHFLKMAYLVQSRKITLKNLEVESCQKDPALDSKFKIKLTLMKSKFHCQAQDIKN